MLRFGQLTSNADGLYVKNRNHQIQHPVVSYCKDPWKKKKKKTQTFFYCSIPKIYEFDLLHSPI